MNLIFYGKIKKGKNEKKIHPERIINSYLAIYAYIYVAIQSNNVISGIINLFLDFVRGEQSFRRNKFFLK